MEMSLHEVKAIIKVVSANEKLNAKVMKDIQKEDDCFGREFLETNEECQICQVLAEVGDRRAPLSVFCKELIAQKIEGQPTEEKVEATATEDEEEKVISDIKTEAISPKKKIQKTKFDGIGPGGIEALVNKRLEEKVPDEEIKKEIFQMYIQAGRDEKYSKVKAGMWVSYTKGRRKKGIFVTGE